MNRANVAQNLFNAVASQSSKQIGKKTENTGAKLKISGGKLEVLYNEENLQFELECDCTSKLDSDSDSLVVMLDCHYMADASAMPVSMIDFHFGAGTDKHNQPADQPVYLTGHNAKTHYAAIVMPMKLA